MIRHGMRPNEVDRLPLKPPPYFNPLNGEGRVSPSNGRSNEKDKMQASLAAAPRPRLPDDSKLKLPLPPNSNGLMMEVWASVASWFFRPDAPYPNYPPTSVAGSLPALRGAGRPPNPRGPEIQRHFPLTPSVCVNRQQMQFPDHSPQQPGAIRCTVPGCSCDCFTPGKTHIRYCESCTHSWVPHALDKLGWKHLYGQSPVEPVQPNVAFDIASLVLYGTQALPIRLKILLDRLFSVLQRDEVLQVLHGFGWTHEDYARGYILQEPHGAVLERWNICSPEEEPLVLQQFLRFGETRAITQQLLLAQADQASLMAAVAENDRDRSAEKERDRHLQLQQQIKAEVDLKRLLDKTSLSKQPKVEPEGRRSRERSRTHSPQLPPPSRPSATPPSPRDKQAPLNLKHPLQNGPPCSMSSPPNLATSPLSVSPLNRLQNMQPFDFRKMPSVSAFPQSEPSRRRPSDACESSPALGSVSSPTWHLPPPMPLPPTTSTAPVNLSQQALSTNPLLPNFPPLGDRKSPLVKTERNSEFGSDDDEEDDESASALNLSRDGLLKHGRKSNHQRKTISPLKRGWGGSAGLPLNLGTQLINPATGKKRVQCNVCLKTFCDKGALKIHFSAVHLREMHKCTVEGCNMMFSSRRSRNRHSANPNPKLHSPHLRRKISPHDGRSSQGHPLLIPPHGALSLPGGGLNPLSFGAFPLLTPPPELRHQAAMDLKQSMDLSMGKYDDRRHDVSSYQSSEDGAANSGEYMDEDEEYEGIVVVGDDEQEEEKTSDEDVKRTKISMSDVDDADSNEDSLSVVDNQSVKEETSGEGPPKAKRGRKRKNQNPTKCALSVRMTHDDGMSTDGEGSRGGDNDKEKAAGEGHEKKESGPDPLQQLENLSHARFGDRDPRSGDVPPSPTSTASSSASNDRDSANEETNEGDYPSKRSRDRNSSSSDLHRKLIAAEKSFPTGPFTPDFLSRLYSEQLGYPMNGERLPLPFPGLGFPGLPYPFLSNGLDRKESRTSTTCSPVSPSLSEFDLPTPDREGRLPCRFCGSSYTDAQGLRDHIASGHVNELYRCSVSGCPKAFTSRASRNRHAERHEGVREDTRRGSASSTENGS